MTFQVNQAGQDKSKIACLECGQTVYKLVLFVSLCTGVQFGSCLSLVLDKILDLSSHKSWFESHRAAHYL